MTLIEPAALYWVATKLLLDPSELLIQEDESRRVG